MCLRVVHAGVVFSNLRDTALAWSLINLVLLLVHVAVQVTVFFAHSIPFFRRACGFCLAFALSLGALAFVQLFC
jgi:hypothetical protein